jgi:hypothetical protein
MISTLRQQTAVGVLLIFAGVVLLAVWGWYFMHLVRPIDAWDFSPLPLPIATIAVGATVGGLRVIPSAARPTLKRDAVFSLGIGAFVAIGLNVLYNAVANPTTIDNYLWLSKLQDSGSYVAGKVARFLYPIAGYPWNLRVAVPCGYATLVAQWTLAALAIVILIRLALSAIASLSSGKQGTNAPIAGAFRL